MFARVVQLILEHIGKRNDSSATGINKVRRVFGAAPAATKQACADGGICRRSAHQLRFNEHGPGRRRRYADEFPTVEFI